MTRLALLAAIGVGGTVWAYEPPVATASVRPDRMIPPVSMLDDTRALFQEKAAPILDAMTVAATAIHCGVIAGARGNTTDMIEHKFVGTLGKMAADAGLMSDTWILRIAGDVMAARRRGETADCTAFRAELTPADRARMRQYISDLMRSR
jgi:hypothetical protein